MILYKYLLNKQRPPVGWWSLPIIRARMSFYLLDTFQLLQQFLSMQTNESYPVFVSDVLQIFRRHHRTKCDDGGLVVKGNQAESHIHPFKISISSYGLLRESFSGNFAGE
ncbi:MAG: hypothetical protein HFF39_05375 [Lawsonibacter sp.]|nr:hypothetical protein [Lawsonibacter sp.]